MSKVIGERYWSQNLLWLVDSYQATDRTIFWSEALGSLLEARGTADIPNYGSTLALPEKDKVLARIGGLQESKVRFFAWAIGCNDLASSKAVFLDPRFDGGIALITGPITESGVATRPCDLNAVADFDAVPSPEPSVTVVNFRSNGASFQVNNPANMPVLMTYSDAWSDRWSARINGQSLPVLRSWFAYKAVVVPPGTSLIEFVYEDRLEQLVFVLQTAGSIAFLAFLIWLIRSGKGESGGAGAERAPTGFSSSTT